MNSEEKLIPLINTSVTLGKVEINKVVVNYICAGKGRPLLLIHGANIGWGQWYPNIADFSKKFKVFAIDLPGSGNSTRLNYQKSDFVKDYVDIVEKFIEKNKLRDLSIIGHSLGGWIAIKLALRKHTTIKKIVLVNSLGFSDYVPLQQKILSIYPLARLISMTVMRPTKENIRKFLTGVFSDPRRLKEEFVDYYYHSVSRDKFKHPFIFINSLMKRFKIKKELVLLNELSQLKMPILIILGEKDIMIPSHQVKHAVELIPNARLELLADAGHVPSIEKSEEFNKMVLDFLA